MDEDIIKPLPCPFCGWTKIRVTEDEIKDQDHMFTGSKYTYCWCKPCGTRGPRAYSVEDDYEIIYNKCVERWNERSSIVNVQHNEP